MEEKTAVRKSYKKMPRKKVCAFCQEKVTEIDYKRVEKNKSLRRSRSYEKICLPHLRLCP